MRQIRKAIFEQIVRGLEDAVVVVDTTQEDMPLSYVNAGFESLTGFTSAEVLGKNCRFLQGKERDQPGVQELRAAVAAGRSATVVIRNFRKDGGEFLNRVSVRPVLDTHGRVDLYLGVMRQVDRVEAGEERVKSLQQRLENAELQLKDAQRHDPVTGIANLSYFEELLARDWANAQRQRLSLAILRLKIDYFPQYVETFGRRAADSCLRLVAHAIRGRLRRASDLGARFADDEFIALVSGLELEVARDFARELQENVAGLVLHNPRSRVSKYVTVSVGVATRQPGKKDKVEALVSEAGVDLDAALARLAVSDEDQA